MLSVIIKKDIEKRHGKSIRYPKDCESLAMEISETCNERVSPSTIKRLFGFTKGTAPRLSTLDIIANYLSCNDWDNLLEKYNNSQHSEFGKIEELSVENINSGDRIEFKYEPNREVVVEYKGDNNFIVLSSINSKLQPKDRFKALHFVLNYPLFIHDVIRNKTELGQYKAGKVSGLTSIKKL